MNIAESLALAAHFAVAVALTVALAGPSARALRACIAFGLALGLASASAFWELRLCGAWDWRWRCGEMALGAVATLALVWRRRGSASSPAPGSEASPSRATRALVWFVAALALLFCAQLVLRACANPTGSYDAAANWNLRARAVFLAAERWQEYFANQPGIPHPDYPALVPLSLARLWRVGGEPTGWAPLLLGVTCAGVTVVAVGVALARARGARAGLLAAVVLLATPQLARQAVAQVADVPVGLMFTLAGIVAWRALDAGGAALRSWVLCGALLGVGMWTKNEGAVFALLLGGVAVATVGQRERGRAALRVAVGLGLGAAPFLATLLAFKAAVPQANELLPWGRLDVVGALLLDVERWRTAIVEIGGRALAYDHFLFLALTLAVVLVRRGTARGPGARTSGVRLLAAVLVAMLLAHLGVALVTPYAIDFHIQTTETRLLLQIWPLTVLALCALMPDPWGRRQLLAT